MSRLLSANFSRMKKDKFYWIGMVFMIIVGIAMPISHYRFMQKHDIPMYIDNGFFVGAVLIGMISSVFCSLFVGTEYSDGTIRNKVVVGQTRTAIYFSNLITCAVASTLMCAASFISNLCVGIPLLGFFTLETKTILIFVLLEFVVAITFSSIFTLIAMLNQKKATVAVICILSTVILMFAASYIIAQLSEPEMYESYSYLDEESGGIVTHEAEQNPRYVGGIKRGIYEFIVDFLPSGQAIKTANMSVKQPWLLLLYSGIIIVGTTGMGLWFFRKKDLK